MPDAVISTKLPSRTVWLLQAAAGARGCSVSAYVRAAIEDCLEVDAGGEPAAGPVEKATRAQVEAALLDGDPRAAAAIALARSVDNDPASATASELRRQLSELLPAATGNGREFSPTDLARLEVRLNLAGYSIVHDDGTPVTVDDTPGLVAILAEAFGAVTGPGRQDAPPVEEAEQ